MVNYNGCIRIKIKKDNTPRALARSRTMQALSGDAVSAHFTSHADAGALGWADEYECKCGMRARARRPVASTTRTGNHGMKVGRRASKAGVECGRAATLALTESSIPR